MWVLLLWQQVVPCLPGPLWSFKPLRRHAAFHLPPALAERPLTWAELGGLGELWAPLGLPSSWRAKPQEEAIVSDNHLASTPSSAVLTAVSHSPTPTESPEGARHNARWLTSPTPGRQGAVTPTLTHRPRMPSHPRPCTPCARGWSTPPAPAAPPTALRSGAVVSPLCPRVSLCVQGARPTYF